MASKSKNHLKFAAFALAVTFVVTACSGANDSAGNVNAKPSAIASPSPTESAKVTPSALPSEEAKEKPTATASPSAKPEEQSSPAPSEPSHTSKPAPKPSASPEQQPSQAPSDKPSVKPTKKPAPQPTKKPVDPKPTAKPDPKPSAKPSAKPTGKPSPAPEKSVAISDIVAKLSSEIEMGQLSDVDYAMVPDAYNGIDPNKLLEEGVFKQAMIMISVSEYSIVKLKSEKDYDKIKEAFEFRAETVQKNFEHYLPNQYELAKNFQIIRQGKYVLFSISDQQDKIAEVFKGFFKK
ncbi:DUF4358 domain-containing protein [Paenibacillus sp. GCM10027627]|uniref:DUF4358 domain-containing protein n=1 Tax=unclassified Paenibacillus TaxID=185978 RepID=UPI003642C894